MPPNRGCADSRGVLGLQIGSAEQYAQAGDVILSPEVAGVTAGHCTTTPLEGNNARLVSMSKSAVVSGICPDLPMCSWCCHVLHAHTLLCAQQASRM